MKKWISYYRSKCFCFCSIINLLLLLFLNILYWDKTVNIHFVLLELFILLCTFMIYMVLIFPTLKMKKIEKKSLLYGDSLDPIYKNPSSFFLCNNWLVSCLFGNFFIIHTSFIQSIYSKDYRFYTKLVIVDYNGKKYIVHFKTKRS